MNRSQLQELADLACSLKDLAYRLAQERQYDDNMIVARIAGQLDFLRLTLDRHFLPDSVDRSSPMMPRLENCRHAIATVKSLFGWGASQSDNFSSHFSLWSVEWVNRLEITYEELQHSVNSLSVAIYTGLHLGDSETAIKQAEVNKKTFDLLSERIIDNTSQMFQHDEPGTTDWSGFTVSELMIASENSPDSTVDFKVVCPRAYFSGESFDGTKRYVTFCCCCDEAPHQPLLHYERWAVKSIPRQEICLDGLTRWSVLLLKSDGPVVVRLSDISRFCSPDLAALALKFHQAIFKDHAKSSSGLPGTGRLEAKLAGTEYVPLEWSVNDSGFPATRIRSVTDVSGEIRRTISNPSIVKLKHYHLMKKDIDEPIVDAIVPEPYIRLILEVSGSAKQRKEVLVKKETRVSHENNNLGRLVVTLLDAVILHEGEGSDRGRDSKVNFSFDLQNDAETFARYIKIAQVRLRAIFVSCRMPGESFIHFREFPVTTLAGRKTLGRFAITAQDSEDGSECKHRALLSINGNTSRISFENVAQKGLIESLEDIEIRVADDDRSGRPLVFQTTWQNLTRRQMSPSNEAVTFVNSRHERTADDWIEEMDKLIGVMKRDKNDCYERVKIAVIDSGLNDTVKSRYMAKNRIFYRDFTREIGNDSWHGTCCAKIISDVYEEAILFIARIFEREHADERDGPIRMAQAIDWAISPPNCVDIISISAGFRHYSKELYEAVTRANAAGILVVAAAANWQNTHDVAYPARHSLATMCIYSTNMGNQSSDFNPEPRSDAPNFAILGEGFHHPDQRRNEQMSGTSMATAVAVGLAANIIDFSRQEDNKPHIDRVHDVGKLPGMLAIFGAISKPAGPLQYVAPLKLLPLRHGTNRETDRQRIRVVLSQAMERAN